MNVLVACEESQRVCIAFRERGHRAFSCDIQPCSGGHPEWHIQGDVLPLLNGCCTFYTMDGSRHEQGWRWDLIIAHPPCTDLAISGARWFCEKQKDYRQQKSVAFFMHFVLAHCDHIAVENPVGIMSSVYRKPDQIIQPYEYGDPYRKKTCLWLKGLRPLEPTNIVEPKIKVYQRADGRVTTFSEDYGSGDEGHGSRRSKTYHGIAEAMAEQWGDLYNCEIQLELEL